MSAENRLTAEQLAVLGPGDARAGPGWVFDVFVVSWGRRSGGSAS
jgi:hypothetical protein